MKLCEVDHQPCQQILTGGLIGHRESPRQMEGQPGVVRVYPHGGSQPQHFVHRGVDQIDGAGNSGADDVLSRLGVAAVAANLERDNPFPFHGKCGSGHSIKLQRSYQW